MSKMGNFVFEIQERHASGETPKEIADALNTPVSLVAQAIKDIEEEWPEPDPDF